MSTKTNRDFDDSSKWICRYCGKVDEFKLLGRGIVECSVCGAQYFVSTDGNLFLINQGDKSGNE